MWAKVFSANPRINAVTNSHDDDGDSSAYSSNRSVDLGIEVHAEEFVKPDSEKLVLNAVDVSALAIAAAITYATNVGLGSGFGTCIIAVVLASAAYFSLMLCLAELASGLPFAGLFAL